MIPRKGQSAIEYLTTYGWMLLVIAIVGGAIFSTVQNSAQVQTVSGFQNADVQVSEYGLNEDGLQLSLRAASRDQINIKKVEITDPETGVSADISPSQVVPVGDTTQLNLQNVQTTTTSDTYDMEVVYDSGGLENLNIEGSITGSFGVFNRISLQNAKFNRSTNELQIDVKNTGDNTTNSISYTVDANNTDYTGSLPNLASGETSQINISTDETYPLGSVSLDTEGTQFVDSNLGLKCTPTKGLVGYWPFNEEQTENGWAIDLSGQGNNGSLENGVTTGVDGRVGEAYRFNVSGNYVSVQNSSSLNPENEITLSAIAESSAFTTQGFRRIVGMGDDNHYQIRVDEGRFIGGIWGTEADPLFRTNSILEDNEVNLFTMTYNRSHLKAYLDSNTVSKQAADIGKIVTTGNPLEIGTQGGTGSAEFKGKIDEVRIYNRSLSQEEIQRLNQVRSEDWAVSGCKLTG